MQNTTALQTLINETADRIIDEWEREGLDYDEQMDLLEESGEYDVAITVGRRHLQRVMGVA